MCLNDNSATLSVRYLNAQLTAMWQNAVECVGHEGKKATVDLRSTDYDKHKYTRSLAQFHFAGNKPPRGSISKENLFFDGTFGEPRLEFICNHEAALYLKLQNGHFNKVYPMKANINGYKSNPKDNVGFDGLEVAFRLKFSRRNLSGKDSHIGNGSSHLIQMMILDFTSAQMVLFKSDLPIGTTDSLEWYLKKYLAFLQNAGHHVRFDLPDFDDDQHKPNINYSLATRALEHEELCANVAVHGIGESTINDFLRETWLDVVSKAQGFCGAPPTDKLSSCLTEIRSTWVGNLDNHFHIRFSPPRVKALCKHEVVLYFTAAQIHFYENDDFTEPINSFVDWEFAFIVDVVEDKVGEASSLKLDLTTARFCQHLSTTLAQDLHIHFTHIINFLEYQYMELLVIYKMLCIYYPGGYRGGDVDAPDFSDISEDDSEWKHVPDHSGGGKSSGAIVWSETVQKIALHGFDHMVAVSEESINALFYSLYKAALKSRGCLAEWRYKEYFRAEFLAIRVKLLSDDKALVTFTVDDGHLTLKDKRRKYDFTSWTISYEVGIKMVDQTELHCNEGWLTHLARSVLGTHERHETHSTVKHIVLDFATAKYIYKHSSMPGMWDGGYLSAVDKLESFIYYMRKYLKELSTGGHNIIHSTPIFPHTHPFGLTAASFKMVSKTAVSVANCMFKYEAPVIMVLGMMCGRALLAQQPIPWGSGWVIPGGSRGAKSHGTICLSRASFLEGKLLATLELVNRRTTVVPRFPRESEEEWKVYLTTWDNHRYRKNKQCSWKKVENGNPGWLEYGWEHRDEWSYEHEGTREEASGFSVLCHTKNQLCIPTMYRPQAMEIILRGESVLRLKGKDDTDDWSKRSSAKWSAKIRVSSEATGLRVAIAEQVHPVFEQNEAEGKWHIDTHKLLQENLPRVVDVKEVLAELKQVFEGAWEYCSAGLHTYNLASPVFTQNGDLIVQLRGLKESSTTKTLTSSTSSVTSAVSSSKLGLLNRVKGAITGYTLPGPEAPLLKKSDSFLTTSSASVSPLRTPPAVDADQHPLIADGSDQHFDTGKIATNIYVPQPKMELPQLPPPVHETDSEGDLETDEPDLTLAGF